MQKELTTGLAQILARYTDRFPHNNTTLINLQESKTLEGIKSTHSAGFIIYLFFLLLKKNKAFILKNQYYRAYES